MWAFWTAPEELFLAIQVSLLPGVWHCRAVMGSTRQAENWCWSRQVVPILVSEMSYF